MLLRLLFLACLMFTSYLSQGQTAGEGKPRIPVAKAPDAVPSAGTVYVVGDVRKSTDIVIKGAGPTTVLQAIATAGGPNPTAKLNRAKIIRKGENGSVEIPVNIGDILSGKSPDVTLQAGDILFVPSSVSKSARKPQIYDVPPSYPLLYDVPPSDPLHRPTPIYIR